MSLDSNIEFVLHSGRRVQFMRPLQIGYHNDGSNIINISVPERMEEYKKRQAGRSSQISGYFFPFRWAYDDKGDVKSTEILNSPIVYLSEIAKWSSVEPTVKCEPGCMSSTGDHGGRCTIDPVKFVLVKGISKQQLSRAFDEYVAAMSVEDYVRYIQRQLGDLITFRETLKVVRAAEKL